MGEVICPNCKHSVKQHDEFFCSCVGCMCNLSHDTAEARYWAIEYYRAYNYLYELFGLKNWEDDSANY